MKSYKNIMGVVACLLIIVIAGAALAKKVDVGGGTLVTKTSYRAPFNEQPFFGFAKKTSGQIKADKELLLSIKKMGFSKDQAAARAIKTGWRALGARNYGLAARRFNQAYLVKPTYPDVFHAFAVIAHVRFRDEKFAEELFQTGSRMNGRSPRLMADYGRFLMIVKKPGKALGVLEEAVLDLPKDPSVWSNLAFARHQIGNNKQACTAAKMSARLNPSASIKSDLRMFYDQVDCGRHL